MTDIQIKQKATELLANNQLEEALAVLKKFCDVNPDDAQAFYLLGRAAAQLGDFSAAIEALRRSVKLYPQMPRSHLALGAALLKSGDLDAAVESFQAALALDGSIVAADITLTNILITQGKIDAARERLNRLLSSHPQLSGAYNALSRIENIEGNYDAAISHLKFVLQYDQNHFMTLSGLGNLLSITGQTTEAEDYFLRALNVNPDSTEVISGLSSLYHKQGKLNKAAELITPLLNKGLLNVELGFAFLNSCKYMERCEEAIAYMERLLTEKIMGVRSCAHAHFELGRELDRLEQYDSAFSHYQQGNALNVSQYDSIAHEKVVSGIISVFRDDWKTRLPQALNSSNKPIFIVGMPRSGTSLTEQILAAHPRVYGAGELTHIDNFAREMHKKSASGVAYPQCLEHIDAAVINNLAKDYLQHINNLSGNAERVVDKMPANIYHLGLIQLLFPDACIIHTHRDPLDTSLSIYFQDSASWPAYANDLFSIGTRYYQYQRLTRHWEQELTLPVLNVNYEKLVSDQEATTRDILKFCGLEWDDNCLAFHKLERVVATASFNQVRQPMYTSSVKRWLHYEHHLDELKRGLDSPH